MSGTCGVTTSDKTANKVPIASKPLPESLDPNLRPNMTTLDLRTMLPRNPPEVCHNTRMKRMKSKFTQARAWMGELLDQLYHLKQEQPILFNGLPHSIDIRNAKDKARHDKLAAYPGPDRETLDFVEANWIQWNEKPETFWQTPSLRDSEMLDPIARTASYYIKTKRLDKSLCECLGIDAHEAQKTLARMLSDGSRYINLEKSLGDGVTLVLGCETAEDKYRESAEAFWSIVLTDGRWTKILHKSGSQFDQVVAQMQQTLVGTLAPKYGPVRHALINWYISLVDREIPGHPPLLVTGCQPPGPLFTPAVSEILPSTTLTNQHDPLWFQCTPSPME
nr:hypothetical protein CFP56_39027 [Quercus suber]